MAKIDYIDERNGLDFSPLALRGYSKQEEIIVWQSYQKTRPWISIPADVVGEIPEETGNITLSSLRKRTKPMLSTGYVKQTRAGRWLERSIVSHVQNTCHIKKLKHDRLWDGTEVKLYVKTDDIEERTCTDGEQHFLCFHVYKVPFVSHFTELPFTEMRYDYIPPEKVKIMRDVKGLSIRSVMNSCNRFKWLVRANEKKIRLFVTLTYAENMTDTKRLYEDFRRFWLNLKNNYNVSGYLVAFEPQKRGAWHAHVLLCSNQWSLRIPNKEIHALWGKGFTKTQRVKHINDIGSYLTAYLTNVKQGAKTKKGARLEMYPKGFHFARHSKFILKVDTSRWKGNGTDVPNLDSANLLYDYHNEFRLSREFTLYSHRFCFLYGGDLNGSQIPS